MDAQREMDGLRKPDVVPKAAAQIDCRDVQQLGPQEKRARIFSLHQTEPCQVKEEELEEDITKDCFSSSPTEGEAGRQSSQLHQQDRDPSNSSSTRHLKREVDGDECGRPEPAADLSPLLNSGHQRSLSSESDTDDSEDWRETSSTPSASTSTENLAASDKAGDGQSLTCVGCGRVCSTKRGLNLHRNACSGGSFTCSVCGKCFTQRASLKTHMRIHTGEKPFECSFCGKCFNQREYLKTHMRIHTGEKPFGCSFCGKCFNQRENLKTHMRIHTGEKPFRCSHCGVCFSWRETLKYHTRSHTGEKPYTCLECGKSFTASSHLRRHERSHT